MIYVFEHVHGSFHSFSFSYSSAILIPAFQTFPRPKRPSLVQMDQRMDQRIITIITLIVTINNFTRRETEQKSHIPIIPPLLFSFSVISFAASLAAIAHLFFIVAFIISPSQFRHDTCRSCSHDLFTRPVPPPALS